jgi:hypothetical protein
VLNIPYTGPGLPLAPKADLNDGMLDLICFNKAHRNKLSDWFETPAEGPPPGTTRRGRMISFSFRNAPWRVDDEAHAASGTGQTVTLTCDDTPVIIIESKIDTKIESEKRKSEAA